MLFILLLAILSAAFEWHHNDDDEQGGPIRFCRRATKRDDRRALQESRVRELHNKVLWPTSAQITAQLEAGDFSAMASFMEENVIGRVRPLGTFDSILKSGEYFYGLAGPAIGAPTTGRVRVTQVNFVSPINCDANKCSSEVVYTATSFDNPNLVLNFTHAGDFYFNSENKIVSYDVRFIRLLSTEFERILPPQLPFLLTPEQLAYYNSLSAADQVKFIQQFPIVEMCTIEAQLCHGDNDQYKDYLLPDGTVAATGFEVCVGSMIGSRFGSWEEADQDTVMCRYLHSQMVLVNPTTHCKHMGPDGGGKCIFHSDSSYFEINYAALRDPQW